MFFFFLKAGANSSFNISILSRFYSLQHSLLFGSNSSSTILHPPFSLTLRTNQTMRAMNVCQQGIPCLMSYKKINLPILWFSLNGTICLCKIHIFKTYKFRLTGPEHYDVQRGPFRNYAWEQLPLLNFSGVIQMYHRQSSSHVVVL